MSEPLVLVEEVQPKVVALTLNRPEQRNALNVALMEELCSAFDRLKEAGSHRVILLKGAGSVFCAGLDLKEGQVSQAMQNSAQLVARLLQTIYESPLVTIALVHGAAIAGGAGIMSACDFVLAASGTRMGYPETRRGLVAGLVMTFMCRQLRGRDVRELLLLADLIDADRAQVMGLVNKVLPEKKLLPEALRMAAEVLKGAPGATALTKKVLDEVYGHSVSQDLAHTLSFHMAMRQSEEAMEGMRAFAEKREPHWS